MDERYANIIVDISHEKLDKSFQYLIPDELQGMIQPGTLVQIPFGKGNRLIKGYVLEVTDKAEYPEEKMKYLQGVVTDDMLVETKLIQLAWWMKTNYGSTMITALKTVLPIKKQVKPKEKKYLTLTLSEDEATEKLAFYRQKNQTARARLLQELVNEGVLSYDIVIAKLNISAAVIRALEEQNILQVTSEQVYRNPVKQQSTMTAKPTLNGEQRAVADAILSDLKNDCHQTCLIHGITGSGKTEVYMEIIEEIICEGKQVIVLIPEIALTYQTVMRFHKRFGDRVSTLHSRLSDGERYDQFERAKRGELDVMIGPRSALFTPFAKLGLIIIDEEHEGAYKSDTMPKYHAREVAAELARLHNATLILGSATPSVVSYYKAKCGTYKLYEIKERAIDAKLPTVYTVDLREELKKGNRSVFSDQLHELIEDRLRKGEQIMLFLNRRGYAGFVSCRACGHVMKCPHCDVALSAHKNHKLVCHYCGYEEPEVKNCPECGSKYIGGMKAGTQQIEQLIQKSFPTARVLRMDMDTTKTKDGHEKILSAFANREADILVGTQMIVKGHDFPYVTLVGILAADLSLYVNDYRASERTFQLLTQAAGRAGRDVHPGEVVIQTYSPEHYSIQAAARQDYVGFYEEEIGYRSLMQYPPTGHMLAVLVEGIKETETDEYSTELAEVLQTYTNEMKKEPNRAKINVIGPTDASIKKISDVFRRIIYVKTTEYDALTECKDKLEQYMEIRLHKDIRVQFDFNPMNAY
ncbi:MAG TPA: primosomal protein N' [Lachnospiraceae bacterium]|nr:primosomal protein N' [Lachnospiraceae bacterium]